MATLVIKPVQSKPWALFSTIDFLWRAPACFLFVTFIGEIAVKVYPHTLCSPYSAV